MEPIILCSVNSYMLRVLLGITIVAILVMGCSNPRPESKNTHLHYPTNLEIPAILLKPISAGEAKVDDIVPFAVADEIRASDGQVLFFEGQVILAKVSWSRSEGTLSGLVNQPARLEVTFDKITIRDGSELPLSAERDRVEPKFQLTRENTSPASNQPRYEISRELQESLREKLASVLSGESVENVSDEALDELHTSLKGVIAESEYLKAIPSGKESLQRTQQSIRRLSLGEVLTEGMKEGVPVLSEALYIARLAGNLSSGLSDKFKGRTIKAFPGMKIKLYLAGDKTITVPEK